VAVEAAARDQGSVWAAASLGAVAEERERVEPVERAAARADRVARVAAPAAEVAPLIPVICGVPRGRPAEAEVDPEVAERLVVAVVVLVSELAAPAAHLEALPVRLALELRQQRLEDG
jgi:hypothetical protein